MKTKLGFWGLLVLPPFFFFLALFFCLFYFVSNQLTEDQITLKIEAAIPLILFLSQLGMLVVLLIYAKAKQQNIFKQTFESPQFTKDLIWGILLGAAIALSYFGLGIKELLAYLQSHFGDYVPAGDTSDSVSGISLLFFVSNVILAPFVEENIYRNVAFKKLKARYCPLMTVLISAFFFGLLHWLGGFWYMLTIALLIGVPFGWIQLKRESILLVFVAHLTLNLLEFVVSIFF